MLNGGKRDTTSLQQAAHLVNDRILNVMRKLEPLQFALYLISFVRDRLFEFRPDCGFGAVGF
jgi:hypothetical protein